jgi:hypothetical protein
MRKVFKNSVSILLAFMYLLASVGIGVHECSASDTKSVVFFYSDSSCEAIHGHCACGSHDCHSIKHSKKCCETEFHHLNSDYDISQFSFHSQQLFLNLSAICTSCLHCPDYLSANSKLSDINYADHPPSITYDTYSFHSQWRL